MKKDSINTVYQIVTDKFIEALEQGNIVWQKPWSGCQGENAYVRHQNGKPYSMLNMMLLAMQGGEPGEYLTLKQIDAEGGKLKKGAKRKMVVFSKMTPKKFEEKDEEGNVTNVKEYMAHTFRYYHVFHVSECEGVKVKYPVEVCEEMLHDIDPIASAEKVINDYVEREDTLTLVNDKQTDNAYYSPSRDIVNVPMLAQYEIAEEYYSTTFHELVHSTGIQKRCDRGLESAAAFGSNTYSKEELVAEMGSAMCINRLGIDNEKAFNNSVAYVQNWLKALRNDNRLIVWASGRAEKAVKYIFNDNAQEEEKD